MKLLIPVVAVSVAFLAACSGGNTPADTGGMDSAAPVDSGMHGDGRADAGADVMGPGSDASTCDAGNITASTNLAGETWRSSTVGPNAVTSGVTSSTYVMMFHADQTVSATLNRVFGATAPMFAGCDESWTFAGYTWTETGTNSFTMHSIATSTSTVARFGCTTTTQNQAATADASLNGQLSGGVETFTISANTVTAMGDSGVPVDGDTWTFTVDGVGSIPLSGTTWQSTTVGMRGMTAQVQSQTYTMTFHADMSFTAQYVRTFSSAATMFAGCTETWALSGLAWTEDATRPSFIVTGSTTAATTVARAGCTTATQNQAATMDTSLDFQLEGGSETFYAACGSMTAMGNSGVPFDGDVWIFQQQ